MIQPDAARFDALWHLIAAHDGFQRASDADLGDALKLAAAHSLSASLPGPAGDDQHVLRLASLGALRLLGELGPALLFLDLPAFDLLSPDTPPTACGPFQAIAQQVADPSGAPATNAPGTHLVAWTHARTSRTSAGEQVRAGAQLDAPANKRRDAAQRAATALGAIHLRDADPVGLGSAARLYVERLTPPRGRHVALLVAAYLAASVCEVKRHAQTNAAQVTHANIARPNLQLGTWRLALSELHSGPSNGLDTTLGAPAMIGTPQAIPAAQIARVRSENQP